MWNNVAEVATVLDFFRLMVPVTLLRRGPDRIPYSPSLFVLAICLCALITLGAATLADRGFALSAMRFGAAALLYCGAVMFLLYLFGFRNRAVQTLTAGFGVGAVFGVVEVLLVLFSGSGFDERFITLAALGLQIWAIVVDGFILSVALGISLALGCLLAFSILLPQVALVTVIGGAPS